MATEIISVRVYDADGIIDSTLTPHLDIVELDTNSVVVNDAVMTWNSTTSHYQYSFTTFDPSLQYLWDIDFWAWAITRRTAFSIWWWGWWVANVGDIWNALIEDNSSVLGSFWRKFSEYGGVSHIVDRSSLDKDSKDKLDKLDNKIKEFGETLKNFKWETIDFEKIVDRLKAVIPNATTNIINSKTPADDIANEILIEWIPAIIDAVEKANELIPIYEELLDYMRKRELEYEETINAILN